MTLTEMRAAHDDAYAVAGKRRYPTGRHVVDLALGKLPEWAIEVKSARLNRDKERTRKQPLKRSFRPTLAIGAP